MWNPRHQQVEDDDESWEVRAFAQDTRNIMAATWPPRSYTCTFCRREFRSAQALGGHMNVHRRDRARLHHQAYRPPPIPGAAPVPPPPEAVAANSSTGLCLLHRMPSPNNYYNNASFTGFSCSSCWRGPSKVEEPSSSSELLDLELRLGHKSPPTN